MHPGAAQGQAVVPEQAVPVLLAAGGAGPPAEPEQVVAAVRHLLQGHLADLARARVAAHAAPPARP